jgi:hypothetical protein
MIPYNKIILKAHSHNAMALSTQPLTVDLSNAEIQLNEAFNLRDAAFLEEFRMKLSHWQFLLSETYDMRADLHPIDCKIDSIQDPGDVSHSLRKKRMIAARTCNAFGFEEYAGQCSVCDRLWLVAYLHRVACDLCMMMLNPENPRGRS